MSDYLTLSEAAEFLSTPRSTLYRWLREDRVPAHKLGRQWRFLRDELEAFRAGGPGDDASAALASVRAHLATHLSPDTSMSAAPAELARALVWEAVARGASAMHLAPKDGAHELRYRTGSGLQTVITLQADAFDALDAEWIRASRSIRDDARRRFFLERGEPAERLQVRYRRLDTLAGPRLTLRLLRAAHQSVTVDRIASADVAATLRRWCSASHGLVLVTGRSGSGKTTTAYSCLAELAASDSRVIFTVEGAIGYYLPGVDQVEVDLHDEAALRSTLAAVTDSDPDVLFLSSGIAQPHQQLLCGVALSAAESGHLVFVQMDADSADDALRRFTEGAGRDVRRSLVGVVWQELVPKPAGGRVARYELERGALAP